MINQSKSIVAAVATGLGVVSASSASALTGAGEFGDASRAIENYVEWRQQGSSVDAVASFLDPVWMGRTMVDQTPESFSVDQVDAMPAMFEAPQLTSLQLYFDDFAIARIDQWTTPGAALLTLFKTDKGWRVATEAQASGACVDRAEAYDADIAAGEILDTLGFYYSAVDQDDPQPLARVHHETWRMKNHEGDAVASEPPDVFAKRLISGKHIGYALDRQITDIQVIYNCLGFVRIDKPSSKGVTVFTFYRSEAGWVVVDKAWSHEK